MEELLSFPALAIALVVIICLLVVVASLRLPDSYFKRKHQRDELQKQMLENPDKQFNIREK